MIEKIKGCPLREKLRIIHLFEADLNLMLGITWTKKMTKAQERTKNLGNKTWGGRQSRSTYKPSFLKMMTYELAQLTRTATGTFDNDAKA